MATMNLKDYAIIIHHTDNDGYLSGTLLRLYANHVGIPDANIRYFAFNYSNTAELEEFMDDMSVQGILTEDTLILMGDVSIAPGTKEIFRKIFSATKNKFWFDHHTTSLDLEKTDEFFQEIPGKRSDDWCGAELIFRAFTEAICSEAGSIPINVAHEVVSLVDDHDRFVHQLDYSREFLSGSMLYPESQEPGSLFWVQCISSWEFLYDVIGKGETVFAYKKQDEEKTLKALGFEREIVLKSKSGQRKALKVYCVNRQYNSDIFGDKYYQYPIVCVFTYNGKGWRYSLYSSKPDACCGKIAQAFSPAGGGHNGAAGFTRAELIFNKLTVVTPPIDCNLEDYFKEYPAME